MNTTEKPNAPTAQQQLHTLEQDSSRLEKSTRRPGFLAPALALIAAFWVSSPWLKNLDSDGNSSTYMTSLIAVIVVLAAAGTTGLRTRPKSRISWLGPIALVIGLLACYSISHGLVASGLAWWVVVPAVVTFVCVWRGLVVWERLGRAELRS